jgi:hypothetical protein
MLARGYPAALGLLFVLAGCAFVPMLGIQNDEVFFAGGIYEPYEYRWGVELFGHRVPVMLLSYLGATKAWFYAAIFPLFPESLESLRIPMLLLGAATIWMFFRLLGRVAGMRAALAGAALLAADPLFLLVTLWGPAMFYHVLFVAALALFVKFHQTGSRPALAAAFFCVGLGLWDKALFLWALGGLGVASAAVFPRVLWRAATPRNIGMAAAAFVIGAFPLLLFNIHTGGETLRGNSAFTFEEFPIKARQLYISLDGSMLFHWMVSPADPVYERQPGVALERASVWLASAANHPRGTLAPLAYMLALALLPFVWRSPARAPALFALVFIAVAWLQMALTRGAGGAAHHTVLLWPMPHLFAAVVFAEASRRIGRAGPPALAAAVLLVAGSGALVVNQYFAQGVRYGPGMAFTDALFPMAKEVAAARAAEIYMADWGMAYSLRFLGAGGLPLRNTDSLMEPDENRHLVRHWISDPNHVFVGHTEKFEYRAGAGERLRKLAAELGYERADVKTIEDECGRPVYEVYRFRPSPAPR